jgi:hypothetical protein
MKRLPVLATIVLFFVTVVASIEGRHRQNEVVNKLSTLTGRVFRSDTGESIANCFIELARVRDYTDWTQITQFPSTGYSHFDLRTDKLGNYAFNNIPIGKYKVSVFAWFPKATNVPCQNPRKAKTADDGTVIVGWQYKSDAFVELVTITGFSLRTDRSQLLHETVKDFDLFCK